MILTYAGHRVDALAFRAGDAVVEDIAHALAQVNRFGGHACEPISVAQHSVYVSWLCPENELGALLHDASEAYIGDVNKWFKQSPAMAGYRVVEEQVQAAIFRRFGCGMSAEVEAADKLMVRWEAVQAYGEKWVPPPGYGPLSPDEAQLVYAAGRGPWRPWPWEHAKRRFLSRFEEVRCGMV